MRDRRMKISQAAYEIFKEWEAKGLISYVVDEEFYVSDKLS